MHRIIILVWLTVAALTARGEELVLTLLAGPGPHVTGRSVRLEVAALNPGGHDVPFPIRSSLKGTLALAAGSLPVTLVPTDEASPSFVPAGGFAVQRFDLPLAADLVGQAILTVRRDNEPPLQAVLRLELPSDPTVAVAGAVAAPLERLAAAAPAVSAISRNFSGRFLPNQPIYFIYGDADQAAKLQFSFDYRLATLSTGTAARPRVGTLRFGYTQRSVWDFDGQSSPFYDTSYLPEIAFSSEMPMPKERSRKFTWLGWRASVQHESNGKDGTDSRSMNTAYFRPRFVLGTLGKWAFVVLPEFQVHLGNSEENRDIEDYRGYGKLRFYFGHNEGPTLMFTGWTGKDFDHGTYQLDLAVPLRLRWLNLESYFYAQYFNGYGESLRAYRHRSDALRAGFALVR